MTKFTLLTGVALGGAALCVAAIGFAQNAPADATAPVAVAVPEVAPAKPGVQPEPAAKCPLGFVAADQPAGAPKPGVQRDRDWFPNSLDLDVLHRNSPKANPLGDDFDYAEEVKKLDYAAVKKDVMALMTTSQEWWPADYGSYAGLFIRLAWHSAGTYRTTDGRGGAGSGIIRLAPVGSWPDNANLDKARRLLWPIKQKYGQKLSWADLIVLSGNVAYESVGLKTFGFAFGRADGWEPDAAIYWGPETKWLDDKRHGPNRTLEKPLGATQMGLIYVNPEGPNGKADPAAAAHDIRTTFGRMGMNDEETVALIAGGHTIGKAHGAADPGKHVGPAPDEAALEQGGLGWKNSFGKGRGGDTITSGLEGAWTSTPVKWSHSYFNNLFKYEWKMVKSPGGAQQWIPTDEKAQGTVPDAHDPKKSHAPIMFTTDLALRTDPAYLKISKRYQENPKEFDAAFAKAWYKLIHRDMGPVTRLIGPDVAPPQVWQDPVPKADHKLIDANDITALKGKLLASGLTPSQLVATAWASASTYRSTDKRGGANGARIRLAPQKDWKANNPDELAKVLAILEKVQADFNKTLAEGKKVSLADVIVLGGCVGVEQAADKAGYKVSVPFTPGRTDATAEQTDAESFAVLEPTSDAFRNHFSRDITKPAEALLVDRAALLGLSAPEMTVLVGGMRVLNANTAGIQLGVFTKNPGALSTDFFTNVLDMGTEWKKSPVCEHFFDGRDTKTGAAKWTASSADLVFASNSQLRGIAEVYASEGAGEKFVRDFVFAWNKVMNADRFDLTPAQRVGTKPAVTKK